MIVVNYNSGELLAQCVRSLMQSSLELQIIIVDNASSDRSIELLNKSLQRDTAHTLKKNSRNLGFSAAVNQGIRCVIHETVLLLNPDCIVAPDAILELKSCLFSDRNAAIAGGLILNLDGTEQRGCRRREPTPLRSAGRILDPVLSRIGLSSNKIDMNRTELPEKPERVDAVSGAFMLFRTESMYQLNGMDEDYFLHWEDLDICRRARNAGRKVLFCPDAVAIHFKSASGGVTSVQVERWKHTSMLLYFRKHYPYYLYYGLVPILHFAGFSRILFHSLCSRNPGGESTKTRHDVSSAALTWLGRLSSDPPADRILITGATSQLGDYLLRRMNQNDRLVLAVTRTRQAGQFDNNVWWVSPALLDKLIKIFNSRINCWFHVAPIWLGETVGRKLVVATIDRVVAVSSSSILTKRGTEDKLDSRLVRQLRQGELWFQQTFNALNVPVTLFRPTMIYGNQNNKNISHIARFVRLFRFYPLVGSGSGLRQPVHADDVAQACIRTMSLQSALSGIYTLAGSEVLTYRQMVTRVFSLYKIKPRFLSISPALFRMVLRIVALFPGMQHITPAMVDRINKDMVFNIEDAVKDLDYRPRKFDPVQ